jgi:hypothetical protein
MRQSAELRRVVQGLQDGKEVKRRVAHPLPTTAFVALLLLVALLSLNILR